MRYLFFLFAVTLAAADRDRAIRDYFQAKTAKTLRSPKFAEGCPAAELQLGSSTEAALSLSDCSLREFDPGAPIGIRVDVYTISLEKNLIVDVNTQSDVIEPDLYILNADGDLIAGDETSETDKQANVAIHLEAGKYTVLATSRTSGTGAYKISVRGEEPRKCAPEKLPIGEAVDAAFTDTDCRIIDLAPYATDRQPLDGYTLDVEGRKALFIEYSSASANGLVLVIDSKDRIVANSSDIGTVVQTLASVTPGKYFVFAASENGYGAYKLKASIENLRNCPPGTLNAGEIANGQLTVEDCRNLDLFVPGSDPSPTDPWIFEIKDRALVTVTLRSAEFDALLSLDAKDDRILAYNDDADDRSLDSQLKISVAPGTYRALASTIDTIGSYTITYNTEALRNCEVQELSAGSAALSGVLTGEDCRVLDHAVPSTDIRIADGFRFRGDAKAVYTIEVTSQAFSPAIRVYNSKGTLVFTRNAANQARTLKLDVLLAAGDYTMLVLSQGAGGAYTAALTTREAKVCDAPELPLNGQIEGALAAGDCLLSEVVPAVFANAKADTLRLVVAEKKNITVAAESKAFPPLLLVLNSDNAIVASNLNDSYLTMADLTGELPAATYIVVITNVLGLEGPYGIKASAP